MPKAPKRIWADPDHWIEGPALSDLASQGYTEYIRSDRIEELEAKLAKAVEALDGWLELASHCSIEEGVCCCGDSMENHSEPMDCGHMPVDHGVYIATGLVETTRTTLAELTGESND